jgi:hypothetical protein
LTIKPYSHWVYGFFVSPEIPGYPYQTKTFVGTSVGTCHVFYTKYQQTHPSRLKRTPTFILFSAA